MAAGRPLDVGKLPGRMLDELLAALGDAPAEVRLGPALGEDACVIDVPEGALVVASDPITLTGAHVGRYAVIVNANDVAVTGARPRWFLATLLLPVGTTEDDVRDLFHDIHEALAEFDATLVGGHTEITTAVRQPVVVGQMLGVAARNRVITTGGARPGDVVVQIGAVPVEGAAVLATEAAASLGELEPALLHAAAGAVDDPGINVVAAALRAAELGATSLHDPTEGGLASGLHELAAAAGVRLTIDRSRVCWFEPGVVVCAALGLDPWATIASGSVLATFDRNDAEAAVVELRAQGHVAAVLGEVATGAGVHDTDGVAVPWPARDETARFLSS